MLNKIFPVILLGVFAGMLSGRADTTAAAAGRVKGQIIAARVQGHVEAVLTVGGATRTLHSGDKVSEQTRIVTAAGASVILVFSNGASVDVAPNSTLDIQQFDQDPFSGDLKVSDLKAEPGTSTTRLNLTKGELVGKVVHLNVDRGSQFIVETPVGAAGIRGTTFEIIFTPNPDGTANFTVMTSDGTVVYTGLTTPPVSIPAGKELVAKFTYAPPATPTLISEQMLDLGDISPGDEAQIQEISQAIVDAMLNALFTPGGGNGGGNGGTPPSNNNAPAPAVQAPPQTTPGAGSP